MQGFYVIHLVLLRFSGVMKIQHWPEVGLKELKTELKVYTKSL